MSSPLFVVPPRSSPIVPSSDLHFRSLLYPSPGPHAEACSLFPSGPFVESPLPNLVEPMSSRFATPAALSPQVEFLSQSAREMQALIQALQSQPSTIATPSFAPPALAPVVPLGRPVLPVRPTPQRPRQEVRRAERRAPDFAP